MGWNFFVWGMGDFSFYLMGFGVGLNLIFIMVFYSGLGGWFYFGWGRLFL